MSEYLHDLVSHVEQLVSGMVTRGRIVPSRLTKCISLLERAAARARARGDAPVQQVLTYCQTALQRAPLHGLTDRQLLAIARFMRLIADSGQLTTEDVSLTEAALRDVGFELSPPS